ncbi:hypothetical protein SPRG_07291 [Saprolegnia parasitica CBS 223.65]|uniref:Uncharacterized protein n=1 Tax=Saprolegnia parasitica (strain CBS 223.65) TaxID=695850 RepID=A0A067CMB2_SAPPC|nr:hypothetical protein SPRG_07291 [Saprolegnia parasitica CBS 223.65]KDO27661.1 hypothetical protein SPRG_07291 [Saprolegnia parasitica CBS 223.65]|eukprot:XP_012201474.1 hypothetical protein SPRG_07291 [Saprolegnia parasitica CBS 223.65]
MHARARLAAAYSFPWTVYGVSWSNSRSDKVLAVSSITEEYANHLQILELHEADMAETSKRYTLTVKAGVEHPYPPTRVMWSPATMPETRLASTADYLRIWHPQENGLSLSAILSNNRTGDSCAPLTSCDWSDMDPNILGTSSIDTTCTIWDLNNTKQAKKQIIAHDAEVFDMAFSPLHGGSNIFGSVGADGSLRVFDIRCLESCTIAYETPDLSALLRLAWNKHDANFVAVMLVDSPTVLVLDLRMSASPYAQLTNTKAAHNNSNVSTGRPPSVNAMAWSPTSAHHICTAGEDHEAIMWDTRVHAPVLQYSGGSYINAIGWCQTAPEFLAMSIDKTLHVVTI